MNMEWRGCNNEDEKGMMRIMMAMRIGRMMMTITRMDR